MIKKLLLISLFSSLFACTNKETTVKPFHNERNVSIIYVDILPSFWPHKRFLINVKEKYLLYRNLTTDKRNERIIVQTPNILIALSDEETQILLDAFNKIKQVEAEYIIAPDGTDYHISAVAGNAELISIPGHQAEGLGKLTNILGKLMLERPISTEVKQELLRL